MEEFKLNNKEYIELQSLLKALGWCETGGMAKIVISEGAVAVDGKPELRRGAKIRQGQIVSLDGMSVKIF